MRATRPLDLHADDGLSSSGVARLSPLVWLAGFLIAGPVLGDHLSLLLRTGGWQALAAQLGFLGRP